MGNFDSISEPDQLCHDGSSSTNAQGRARNFKTKEFVNRQNIVAEKTSLHFINAGTQTKVVKN